MDEDTITDLKQFIATTTSQQLLELEQRIDQKIEQKGDEILGAIASTMQAHIDATDERLDDHNKRLRKLEHKPA